MRIRTAGVRKRFGEFQALNDLSVDVPEGSLAALLGPSGSGKTTLLRVIAGLERPDAGRVYFGEEDATDTPARERNVGFVFQHYALFRHMNVFENIAFGLRVRRRAKAEIRDRVAELLALVQLEGFERRLPAEISGGQRQRVALARALASEPKVLLLDEPFGALDAKVRQELRGWLRRLHEQIHVTSLFVTHDREEAFEIADRVVLMNAGQIVQAGTPIDVAERPASPFVIEFLGDVNVFAGTVEGGRARFAGFEVDYPEYARNEPRSATVYARPHELDIHLKPNGVPTLAARVLRVTPAGASVKVELSTNGSPGSLQVALERRRYADLGFQAGDDVQVLPRSVRVFLS